MEATIPTSTAERAALSIAIHELNQPYTLFEQQGWPLSGRAMQAAAPGNVIEHVFEVYTSDFQTRTCDAQPPESA